MHRQRSNRFKVTLEKGLILWDWRVTELEKFVTGNLSRSAHRYGIALSLSSARRKARHAARRMRQDADRRSFYEYYA